MRTSRQEFQSVPLSARSSTLAPLSESLRRTAGTVTRHAPRAPPATHDEPVATPDR
jgi:hypothetical protein